MKLTKDFLGIDNLYNKSIYEVFEILKMVQKLPFFDNSVYKKIEEILNDKLIIESFFNSNQEIDNYIINTMKNNSKKSMKNNFKKRKRVNIKKNKQKEIINKKKEIINKKKEIINKKKETINKKKEIINKKNPINNIKKCSIKRVKNISRSETKEKKFKCITCYKCFSGASGLWYHNKHVHGAITKKRPRNKLVYKNKE
jgi:hypothetical protein